MGNLAGCYDQGGKSYVCVRDHLFRDFFLSLPSITIKFCDLHSFDHLGKPLGKKENDRPGCWRHIKYGLPGCLFLSLVLFKRCGKPAYSLYKSVCPKIKGIAGNIRERESKNW